MSAQTDLVEARVSVSPPADGTGQMAEAQDSGLAWTIIEGLTDDAEETIVQGRPTIVMRINTGRSTER